MREILGSIFISFIFHKIQVGTGCSNLKWKTGIAILILECISPIISSFILQLPDTDKAAHAGGAFGGFVAGFYVWGKLSYGKRASEIKTTVQKGVLYFVTSIIVLVCLGLNYWYHQQLKTVAIENSLRRLYANHGLYESIAKKRCAKILYDNQSYLKG